MLLPSAYGRARNSLLYYLKHTTCPLVFAPPDPITISVDVKPLLQGVAAIEDARFEQGEDDSEGLGVTSRPLSSEVEPEDTGLAEAPVQPCPSSGMQPGAKKGHNAGASIR